MQNPTPSTPAVALNPRRSAFVLTAALALAAAAGCSTDSAGLGERPASRRTFARGTTTAPASQPALLTFATFAVYGTPPAGWHQKTNYLNDRAEHITWVSPSGHTAYGVFYFKLPFPAGHDLAFSRGYLAEVRKREGEVEVLDKHWDEALGGMRFKTKSPKYTVEAKFFVKGLRGYAVYAGTRTDQPADEAEFAQARDAREATWFAYELNNPATQPAKP